MHIKVLCVKRNGPHGDNAGITSGARSAYVPSASVHDVLTPGSCERASRDKSCAGVARAALFGEYPRGPAGGKMPGLTLDKFYDAPGIFLDIGIEARLPITKLRKEAEDALRTAWRRDIRKDIFVPRHELAVIEESTWDDSFFSIYYRGEIFVTLAGGVISSIKIYRTQRRRRRA